MATLRRSRRRSARVVYNRRTAGEMRTGLADGLLAVAETIIEVADPPDATPFGEGLVTTGAAGAWIDGRKVGGASQKPRGLRLPPKAVAAIAGFGFPGRFQELGTIHQAPQPFLTPATELVVPRLGSIVGPFVQRKLRRLR